MHFIDFDWFCCDRLIGWHATTTIPNDAIKPANYFIYAPILSLFYWLELKRKLKMHSRRLFSLQLKIDGNLKKMLIKN